jgi:hypothetical protein
MQNPQMPRIEHKIFLHRDSYAALLDRTPADWFENLDDLEFVINKLGEQGWTCPRATIQKRTEAIKRPETTKYRLHQGTPESVGIIAVRTVGA